MAFVDAPRPPVDPRNADPTMIGAGGPGDDLAAMLGEQPGDLAGGLQQDEPLEAAQTLLSSMIDTGAADTNPNRLWQRTAPTLPKINTSLHADDDEREKVDRVLELYRRARDHRRTLIPRWRESYFMLANQYWGMVKGRPDWLPAPAAAEIFPIAATLAGWLTDQHPEPTVSAAALPHDSFAEMMNHLAQDLEYTLKASHHANSEELEISRAAWDAVVYGTGVFKTFWDPWAAGGIGDARFCRVSPFNLLSDPMATDDSDGNFFIELRAMSLQELDRRYPGTYEMFAEGGGGGDVDADDPPTHIDFGGGGRGPAVNPGALGDNPHPRWGRSSERINPDLDTTVTVIECWVREHELVSVTDSRTGEETHRASDEWRLIVVANSRVIMDTPAHNLFSHGQHPFSVFKMFDFNGDFWGFSLVELLVSPQKAMNRILAALQHNIELTGNPMLRETQTGGTGSPPLRNVPGQRVPVPQHQPDAVSWLEPPKLDQTMMQLLEYWLKRMEAISGLSAVVKGNAPSGRNAQGVVDAIQEAAFVRIRMTLRNMEHALRGVLTRKASIIIENYSTPRMVSIAGPRAERSSIALRGHHFMLPTDEGNVPMQFQLLVDMGSQTHTSRAMREDRAVQLYTLEAIDRQALLADVNYPNAQEVAKRMDEMQAQMAQMAQAGEQPGPGARERQRA